MRIVSKAIAGSPFLKLILSLPKGAYGEVAGVTILAEASVVEKADFFSGEHLAGQNSWEDDIK
jgi:hypothetical protein